MSEAPALHDTCLLNDASGNLLQTVVAQQIASRSAVP